MHYYMRCENYIGSPERKIWYTTRFDHCTVQNQNQFPKDIPGVLIIFFGKQ